jgi:hypothetical protein
MSRFRSATGQVSINFRVHLKTVIINYIPGRARACAEYQGNRTLPFIMHQVHFFCPCSASYVRRKHGLLLEDCIYFIYSLFSHLISFLRPFDMSSAIFYGSNLDQMLCHWTQWYIGSIELDDARPQGYPRMYKLYLQITLLLNLISASHFLAGKKWLRVKSNNLKWQCSAINLSCGHDRYSLLIQ